MSRHNWGGAGGPRREEKQGRKSKARRRRRRKRRSERSIRIRRCFVLCTRFLFLFPRTFLPSSFPFFPSFVSFLFRVCILCLIPSSFFSPIFFVLLLHVMCFFLFCVCRIPFSFFLFMRGVSYPLSLPSSLLYFCSSSSFRLTPFSFTFSLSHSFLALSSSSYSSSCTPFFLFPLLLLQLFPSHTSPSPAPSPVPPHIYLYRSVCIGLLPPVVDTTFVGSHFYPPVQQGTVDHICPTLPFFKATERRYIIFMSSSLQCFHLTFFFSIARCMWNSFFLVISPLSRLCSFLGRSSVFVGLSVLR